MTDALNELIEASDLAGLVRYIDGTCDARDWDGLVAVIEQCEEAVERGKQVWGARQFAQYRMALDAPADHAATVLHAGVGRFAVGPLWEVAASTHSLGELAPLVEDPQLRVLIAHERMLRGDDVDESFGDRMVVDAPLHLASWEPDYPTAVYRSDGVADPEIDWPPMSWLDLPTERIDGDTDATTDALVDLVQPWVDDSNGRGEAIVVEGSAIEAIRALGPRRVQLTEVSLGEALALMTWTGASGGAHGRRRGTPVGRALTWWTLAMLVGLDEAWPVSEADLGHAAGDLRWWKWDPGDEVGGWGFYLAVEDPVDGLAWAVSASDAV
jgi:hypothetical protein